MLKISLLDGFSGLGLPEEGSIGWVQVIVQLSEPTTCVPPGRG